MPAGPCIVKTEIGLRWWARPLVALVARLFASGLLEPTVPRMARFAFWVANHGIWVRELRR